MGQCGSLSSSLSVSVCLPLPLSHHRSLTPFERNKDIDIFVKRKSFLYSIMSIQQPCVSSARMAVHNLNETSWSSVMLYNQCSLLSRRWPSRTWGGAFGLESDSNLGIRAPFCKTGPRKTAEVMKAPNCARDKSFLRLNRRIKRTSPFLKKSTLRRYEFLTKCGLKVIVRE